MKTNFVIIVVALLAYWVGLCNASAFYDPGTQRWVNRDPWGESGFEFLNKRKPFKNDDVNLYIFSINNPIIQYDPFDLDWAERYAQCLEMMDPFNLCGYAGAVGVGGMIPTGPIGKVCRRIGAGAAGCAGISYGCMITALQPTPPFHRAPPMPPWGGGCSTCIVNNPTTN